MARARRDRTALVLASGGLTGVAYEIGALRALDNILTNRTVNDFDLYVGTSAGAVVSAALASGMPPIQLAGLMAGTVPGFSRLSRMQVYRPNVGEALSRLRKAPGLVSKAVSEYWQFRDRIPVSEALLNLSPLLPSGIFTNTGVEAYVRETLSGAGLSDDFRDIPGELHIVATDIESDTRVTFSKRSTPNVPISRAVAASSCIPILFAPVEIDGRHYVDGGIKGHAAIDVAIDRGAKLVVVINAIVPLDTEAIQRRATVTEATRSIFDLGIRAIGNQVLRGMLHDTLVDHMREVRANHPDVDFILIEPRPDDEKMFFHEVMSFSAQMIVLQHGYETVIQGLYQTWPYLSRILPKHGIEITRRVVERKPLQVPVAEMEDGGNLLGRLFQTVLDRRNPGAARLAHEAPPREAGKASAAGSAKPPAPGPGAQPRRGTGRARAGGKRTDTGFRPRVIRGRGEPQAGSR